MFELLLVLYIIPLVINTLVCIITVCIDYNNGIRREKYSLMLLTLFLMGLVPVLNYVPCIAGIIALSEEVKNR